jgi:hypothetical protein
MNDYASIGVCPLCSQGRLIIARDNASGALYVLCEECESEWTSPEESNDIHAASRNKFGESTLLERNDLANHPWNTFIKHW